MAESDDAAVYRVSPNQAIIFTTDFFTPVVDDPYSYGAIAAANAMSDVYAMGGQVVLALNIACFPEKMDENIICEILKGGADKVLEAGGAIAGGHTVDDNEPKYGLAVMGVVHPDRVWEKCGAQPGDKLILSKPIGTGLITTAFKGDQAKKEHITDAIRWMKQLNKTAAEIAAENRCHAATDITGFALIGHALEIAEKSQVKFKLKFSDIPMLSGVHEYADSWLFPAGTSRNRCSFESKVKITGVAPEMESVLYTPETSGGLLLSIHDEDVELFLRRAERKNLTCEVIGEVLEGRGIEIDH